MTAGLPVFNLPRTHAKSLFCHGFHEAKKNAHVYIYFYIFTYKFSYGFVFCKMVVPLGHLDKSRPLSLRNRSQYGTSWDRRSMDAVATAWARTAWALHAKFGQKMGRMFYLASIDHMDPHGWIRILILRSIRSSLKLALCPGCHLLAVRSPDFYSNSSGEKRYTTSLLLMNHHTFGHSGGFLYKSRNLYCILTWFGMICSRSSQTHLHQFFHSITFHKISNVFSPLFWSYDVSFQPFPWSSAFPIVPPQATMASGPIEASKTWGSIRPWRAGGFLRRCFGKDQHFFIVHHYLVVIRLDIYGKFIQSYNHINYNQWLLDVKLICSFYHHKFVHRWRAGPCC